MEKYARLSLLICLWFSTLVYGAALVYAVVNPPGNFGPLLVVGALFLVFLCALIQSLRGRSLVRDIFPTKSAQFDWSGRFGIASLWFAMLILIMWTAGAALEIRADPWLFISFAGFAILSGMAIAGAHTRRWIDRNTPGNGICRKCRYDLRGLQDQSVCPECAKPIDHEHVFGRPKPEEEEGGAPIRRSASSDQLPSESSK